MGNVEQKEVEASEAEKTSEVELALDVTASELGGEIPSSKGETELIESDEDDEDDEDDEEVEFEDPIIQCVSRFVHAVNDVEYAIKVFVPLAFDLEEKQHTEISECYKEAEKYAEDGNPSNQALSSSLFFKASRKALRYVNSQVPKTMVKSLFLNIFSDFDTFTGEMLKAIYEKKPELYQSITKSVSMSEIVKCDDIQLLKERILTEEIESFRRKSYVEQFGELEKQFGISTLRKFKNWPKFVEATQRRNLFMHCDAIVSEQYVKICSEHSCDISDAKIGEKLSISQEYFFAVLDMMREVAIKLANVLWRKVLPEEAELSDDALHHIVFDCLNNENWNLAILIGDFIRNDAKSKTDLMARINTVNLVIAQKFSGNDKAASKILHSIDWSASILDFRLAVAVLEDDFTAAKDFMCRIGNEGELVNESAYLEWPLFRDFRQSEEFLSAYESVFGYSFVTKMQENAHEFEKEVDEKQEIMVEKDNK
ncbi:hypothetical protein AAFX24_24515 [Vibrio mediterranei]|uniref:hypothetical protein n=1 Tax=Vibrio mediterranei TaxID=689 RepID=UPI0038CDED2E